MNGMQKDLDTGSTQQGAMMAKARESMTPLELTRRVLDVSATEHQTYSTCPRRWELQVLENLEPRRPPTLDLEFGQGIHYALEGYYIAKSNIPLLPDTKKVRNSPLTTALARWDQWYAETELRLEGVETFGEQTKVEVLDKFVELGDLGEEMLRGYHQYAKPLDDFTIHGIEGQHTGAGKSWLKKHWDDREFIGEISDSAVVSPPELTKRGEKSRRLLVPLLHPKTKRLLKGRPMLSVRLDLLVHRTDPGMKGLWIYDHKTTKSQPNDRGLDFDDQITAYCYAVWRWLGILARGVCFNYLVKQAPKHPRVLKGDKLSSAKNQLTTPEQYREELISRGLMLKDGTVEEEKYADAYEAFLDRGWDPFFKRMEVGRNRRELLSFEERLYDEYFDMYDSYMGDRTIRPNFSRLWCPNCQVAPICQAIEDGSDVEGIIELRYQDRGDRKAEFEEA